YEDPGAVCLSTNLGLRTIRTITDVDPDEVGTYGTSYACSAGADRASLSRVVHVVKGIPEDTARPDVVLAGDRVEVVDRYTAYRDPGASCDDAVSGTSAPSSISVTSLVGGVSTTTPYGVVDPTVIGTYVTTYECTDQAGNKEVGTRTTHVVDAAMPAEDTDGPSIRINGTHLFVQAQKVAYKGTAYCYDNLDGIFMIGTDGTLDVNDAGRSNAVFTCKDEAENTGGSAAVTALVRDIVPPDVVITGASEVTHTWTDGGTSAYSDPGARCVDLVDDNLRPVITDRVTGNEGTIGTYEMTYTCTDNAGNTASKNRTVSVVADTPPAFIPLRPEIDVLLGTEFDPEAYDVGTCKHISRDDYRPTFVRMTDPIDTNVTGSTGEALYECRTYGGTSFGRVQVTTVDRDIKKPVITISGANPVFGEERVSHSGGDVTCVDAFDGVIPAGPQFTTRLADSQFVFKPSVSDRSVHYYVSECVDDAGNRAAEKRSVVPLGTTAKAVINGIPQRTHPAGDNTYADTEGYYCYYSETTTNGPHKPGRNVQNPAKSERFQVPLRCEAGHGKGLSQERMWVYIVDENPPDRLFGGPFEYALNQDPAPVPMMACEDKEAGKKDVGTASPWDITMRGNYTLEFTCDDGRDSLSRTNVIRNSTYVTVGDIVPPVITLVSDELDVHYEADFEIADGAACSDYMNRANEGRDDPVIKVDPPVEKINGFGLGRMNVTYSCIDAAGNRAANMTQTIVTVDGKKPGLAGVPAAKYLAAQNRTSSPVVTCMDTMGDDLQVVTELLREDGTVANSTSAGSIKLSVAGNMTLRYTCTNDSEVASQETVDVDVFGKVRFTAVPYEDRPSGRYVSTPSDAAMFEYVEPSCENTFGPVEPAVAESDVVPGTPGVYEVVFECSDMFSSERITVTHEILDRIPPVAILTDGQMVTTGKDRIITGIMGKQLMFENGSKVTLGSPRLTIPADKVTYVPRADGQGTKFLPIISSLIHADAGQTYFIAADATIRVTEWGERSLVPGHVNIDLNTAHLRLEGGENTRITMEAGSTIRLNGEDDILVLPTGSRNLDVVEHRLGDPFDADIHTFCLDEASPDGEFGGAATNLRFPVRQLLESEIDVTVSCKDRAVPPNTAAFPGKFILWIVDDESPTLTIGPSTYTIKKDTPYIDPGYVCIDNVYEPHPDTKIRERQIDLSYDATRDGVGVRTIVTDAGMMEIPRVDNTTAGTYTVTYTCSDGRTDPATAVRTVIVDDSDLVEDTTPPGIVANWMNDTIVVGESYTPEGSSPGATCTDKRDGQIDAITTTRDYRVYMIPPGEEDPRYVPSGTFQTEPDTSRAGLHTVTYACRDAAGNANSTTVVLGVVTDPVLDVTEDPRPGGARIDIYQAYKDPGFACWNEAGPLPVGTTDDIDNILPGTYTIIYTCSDGIHPEIMETRSVTVHDSVVPVVRVLNKTHEVEVDEDYDVIDNADCFDYDWHARRTVELDLNATITQISGGGADGEPVVAPPGELKTEETGVFRVEYDCEDPAGNLASDNPRRDEDRRSQISVVPSSDNPGVQDGILFVLVGANPAEREYGDPYVDDGATCTDGTRDYPTRSDESTIDRYRHGEEQVLDIRCHVASDDVRMIERKVIYTDTKPPVIRAEDTILRLQPGVTQVEELRCYDAGLRLGDERVSANDTTTSTYVPGRGHEITAPGAPEGGHNTTHVLYTCKDERDHVSDGVLYTVVTDDRDPEAVFTGRAAGGIQYMMPEDGATYGDNPLNIRCADAHPGAILTEVASTPGAIDEPVSTDRNFTAVHECIDEAGNLGMTGLEVVVDGTPPADPVNLAGTYTQFLGAPFVPSMARGDTECPPDEATTLRTAPIMLVNTTIGPDGEETSIVDTSVAGAEYTIRYRCMDLANNTSSELEQTMTIRDPGEATTRFVGDLAEDRHVNNTKYYKPGITCTDDATMQGARIEYKPRLETITADGDYEVQVFCRDGRGVVSDDVNKTVTITLDTIPPVITLTGGDTEVNQGGTYRGPAAACDDPPHGPITDITRSPEAVDTGVIGPVTVTYDCTDLAENAAEQKSHTVTIRPVPGAGTDPVLSGYPDDRIIHFKVGTDPRPTGLVCKDGDLDRTGMIANSSDMRIDRMTANGSYPVTFTCDDGGGNPASVTLTYLADGTRPAITPGNGTIPLE
ncbi:MAG: DUF5011 domain-containing protein, partial [Nitrosopumilus sp.]|nr:DUF5011 domain-containing protein [Nitrosopumilus sp.]